MYLGDLEWAEIVAGDRCLARGAEGESEELKNCRIERLALLTPDYQRHGLDERGQRVGVIVHEGEHLDLARRGDASGAVAKCAWPGRRGLHQFAKARHLLALPFGLFLLSTKALAQSRAGAGGVLAGEE